MPSEPASAEVRPGTPLPRRRPSAVDPTMFGHARFTSDAPPTGEPPPDPAVFLRALGKRVRLLRVDRELTQNQLARAAAMSRSFVSLIEHGSQGVDVVRRLRLATALGMPLTELIDVSDQR